MSTTELSISPNYWSNLKVDDLDMEYLFNNLLDTETPQTVQELAKILISYRISQEVANLKKQQEPESGTYLPKGHYQVGQEITFPSLDWKRGKVINVRQGNNPEYPPFEVIEVAFQGGNTRNFAAGLAEHALNEPIAVNLDDPFLDIEYVYKNFGRSIIAQIKEYLENNPDLIQIAGRWFPRSLLVDVNVGHLNLAEAVLEMSGGGPLTTHSILEQVELPTDGNSKLTEFSFNLALQEDDRFDEVGPAGEILWYLQRMEPEGVQKKPSFLEFNSTPYDKKLIEPLLLDFDQELFDELEPRVEPDDEIDTLSVSLIFPHWQSGTLPLSTRLSRLFPTAYESPRVQFSFVDGNTGETFKGWVVREQRYVYGLKDWYASQGLIPGGLVQIKRGEHPGEVVIKIDKKRPTREWVRTTLVGADGGIVFAMLKQMVSCPFNERMAIFVPDIEAILHLWNSGSRGRQSLENTILQMMRELAKLNPQGQVHAEELYAAVNLVRRCPPGLILHHLVTSTWTTHLGDLYFRIKDTNE